MRGACLVVVPLGLINSTEVRMQIDKSEEKPINRQINKFLNALALFGKEKAAEMYINQYIEARRLSFAVEAKNEKIKELEIELQKSGKG